MSNMSIQSILYGYRNYRHHRHLTLAPVALALLIGLALLVQAASAFEPSPNKQSLNTDKFHYSSFTDAAPHAMGTVLPGAMLVGHVTGQQGSRFRDPISLTLTMGSTEINYPSQNTDASGYFTVSVDGLPSGTYSYRAKGPRYLANAGSVTLSGAPITQLEIGSTRIGDADNNNVVDMVDYSIFLAAFGALCGDPAYDQRVDFDDNCTINAADYTTLNSAFGRLGAPPDSPVPSPNGDAYLQFQPGIAGNCVAPPNGGTVYVGCRFVLDLMLNMNSIPGGIGQQSSLTFTNALIQNARVSTISSACTITSTITPDNTEFGATMRPFVCNALVTCAFNAMNFDPGTIWFPSAFLDAGPLPSGTFRVAQVGLCVLSPGQAKLHWQFSPPSQRNRHTAIVDVNGNMVQDQALFTDFVFNVIDPNATSTPVATSTPTITPVSTPGIRGHVNWDGRDSQPDPAQMLPISLTMRLTTGGPYIDYILQTTDASGIFTVSAAGVPAGTYNWRTKGPQFLANSGTITLTGDPVTLLEVGLMRTGDVNDDNVVNINDFNLLRGSFAYSCGQANYDDRADLTGDCVVNVQDFNLLKRNFALSGAPPLNPRHP